MKMHTVGGKPVSEDRAVKTSSWRDQTASASEQRSDVQLQSTAQFDQRPQFLQLKRQRDHLNNDQALSAGSTSETLQKKTVVQRVIHVDGVDYGAAEQAAFEGRYNQAHRAAMLSAMSDYSHPPASIAAALVDQRRFLLTFLEDDPSYGMTYSAEAGAEIQQTAGGRSREAAELPEFVMRPPAGFEQIDIGGLIMCIGVVIEARRDNAIAAAVGAHFVTPTAITSRRLNERGAGQLGSMLQHVQPQGKLTAILCHAATAEAINPANPTTASMQAMIALNEIVSFLLAHGVSGVSIRQTASKINYQLNANGTSALHG